jgi:Kef-type K+ transport system membrane component KefB
MIMKNKRLIGVVITVLILLLLPLIAMQFTNEVDWKVADFVVMGVLSLGTGFLCELVLRKIKKTEHRILIWGALLVMLFFIWAELAVGIFGTPFAGS